MAYRPYFKFGIEQLQTVFASSQDDLQTLKAIQYELGFRDRPKSRALKNEVDILVHRLSEAKAPSCPNPLPQAPVRQSVEPSKKYEVPSRIVIECANCKTPNFVSTLDGVVQHLSCSSCKLPYEAQFKYDVMRTTFQKIPDAKPAGFSMKWLVVGLTFVIILAKLLK